MVRTISFFNRVADYFLVVFSLYASLWLRFNEGIPQEYMNVFWYSVWFIALGKIIIFSLFGVYRSIVRFIQTYDVVTLIKANIFTTLFFVVVIFIFQSEIFLFPRSVVIIDFILTFIFILGLRYIEKYLLRPVDRNTVLEPQRVLVMGAGEAGSMVLREIRNHPESGMKIIGFIDDDKQKQNMSIGGKKVIGNRDSIPAKIKKNNIDLIIIAIPSAPPGEINQIVSICEKTKAKLKIVPSTYDIIKGDVKFEQIRNIKIEDLLGREEIKFENKNIEKYIKNRVILITGAGGSIGSEISRQVAFFKPCKIILLGKGENSIFDIHFELTKKYPKLNVIPLICDIRDKDKIETIFNTLKPDIVFHAAAHKHVYLMELYPDEAFRNNVMGTLNLAESAIRNKAKRFVFISTDKAVRPTSVMGITKRISEKIILGYMSQKKITKFVAVRFGNVLGSRGSVVPIFKKQIKQGGPLTVTHPEIKRYFMTIPESVQLVLEAGGYAKGGEIFILDMGEPIKIADLAKTMIKLAGFEVGKDIKIKYTGLKPGEKMFEELVIDDKEVNRTKYEKILIAQPESINLNKLLTEIKKIDKCINNKNIRKIKKQIKDLI